MKKISYILVILACSVIILKTCGVVDVEADLTIINSEADTKFKANSETVLSYFDDWINEDLDYDKYYAENAFVNGTTYGSKDTLTVEDRKASHKKMWEKYDFTYSKPLVLLPGVDSKTKEMDGSVRMYYDMNITLTETQKSVSVPLYESLEFNDEGKITNLVFYGDITAYFNSLETE